MDENPCFPTSYAGTEMCIKGLKCSIFCLSKLQYFLYILVVLKALCAWNSLFSKLLDIN